MSGGLPTSPRLRTGAPNGRKQLVRRILERWFGGSASAGGLKLRIICRLHGLTDLDITDLGAIKEFEQFGAQVRFSRRLHAKMVLVDHRDGQTARSDYLAECVLNSFSM